MDKSFSISERVSHIWALMKKRRKKDINKKVRVFSANDKWVEIERQSDCVNAGSVNIFK